MNKKAKKLYNQNWALCHDIVEERDGKACVIPGCGNRVVDLDHCITRKARLTFYEVEILNYVCKKHHTRKSFNPGNWVAHMVSEITRKRIGSKRLDELFEISRGTCYGWSTIWYQEEQNQKLKELLEYYKVRNV